MKLRRASMPEEINDFEELIKNLKPQRITLKMIL